MKIKTLILALAVTAGAALSGVTMAQPATPRHEPARPVQAAVQKAKADGVVTRAERRHIKRVAQRHNRAIHHKRSHRRHAIRH